MTEYFLIESHDLFESAAATRQIELATALAGRGHPVAVFLVQNGVLAARRHAASSALDGLAESGVSVLADDFSLRERGIGNDAVRGGVTPAPIESVVDALARRARVIWH